MTFSRLISSTRFTFLTLTIAACGASEDGTAGGDFDSISGDDDTTMSASIPGESQPATDDAPLAPSDNAAPAPNAPPAPVPGEPGAAAAPSVPLPYRGVNLAGAEFGTAIPGKENGEYKWPTRAEVDYFVGKGMNTFRIGFKWERMQPAANGELDATYASRLDSIVAYATGKNATVILNPHNFARYYDVPVGTASVPASVFADFW